MIDLERWWERVLCLWHAGFLIRQCELNKPRADPQGSLFLDFFKMDRDGRRKGIVKIDLKDLP